MPPTPSPQILELGLLAEAVALVAWPRVHDRIAEAGLALECGDVTWHDLARGAAYADCGPLPVTVQGTPTHLSVHLNRDAQGAITVTHFELTAGTGAAPGAWLSAVQAALTAASDEAVARQGAIEYRFGSGRRALLLTPADRPAAVQISLGGALR